MDSISFQKMFQLVESTFPGLEGLYYMDEEDITALYRQCMGTADKSDVSLRHKKEEVVTSPVCAGAGRLSPFSAVSTISIGEDTILSEDREKIDEYYAIEKAARELKDVIIKNKSIIKKGEQPSSVINSLILESQAYQKMIAELEEKRNALILSNPELFIAEGIDKADTSMIIVIMCLKIMTDPEDIKSTRRLIGILAYLKEEHSTQLIKGYNDFIALKETVKSLISKAQEHPLALKGAIDLCKMMVEEKNVEAFLILEKIYRAKYDKHTSSFIFSYPQLGSDKEEKKEWEIKVIGSAIPLTSEEMERCELLLNAELSEAPQKNNTTRTG